MSNIMIKKGSLVWKIARRLAAFDKYEWQAYPTLAQGKKQTRYELHAVELVGLITEHRHEERAPTKATEKKYVVMGNDYPVGIAASEAAAERMITRLREKHRERLLEVTSNEKEVEKKLHLYYLRSYEFEVETE